MTSDDAAMALFAVRYCLGRHSYAPSLCCDWLRRNWTRFDGRDRTMIVRDVREHVERDHAGDPEDWILDRQTWEGFLTWAESHP